MAEKNWAELFADSEEALTLLPDGDYPLTFVTVTVGKSGGGKKMYKCKAQVESGPRRGKEIWHNFTVSPESEAAMQIFFRQMQALGLEKAFWATLPSDEAIVARLKGARFVGSVGSEEYGGVDRNKIKNIKPAGASATAPPPPPMAASASSTPPPPAAPASSATPPPPPPPPAPAVSDAAEAATEDAEIDVVDSSGSTDNLPF